MEPGSDAPRRRTAFNAGMDDHLRAADRDREDVAAILREQYAQGRLTLEEFDERTTAAFNARTMGDLRPLLADLPAGTSASPASGREPWSRGRWGLVAVAGVAVPAVILIAAITAGHVFAAGPCWIVVLVILKLSRTRHPYRSEQCRRTARR